MATPEAMAEVPEVCDYLPLPAQSGSSRVLKLMRRGYDREKYLAKIAELRSLGSANTRNGKSPSVRA